VRVPVVTSAVGPENASEPFKNGGGPNATRTRDGDKSTGASWLVVLQICQQANHGDRPGSSNRVATCQATTTSIDACRLKPQSLAKA
jgi:hypothetical protein